MDSKPVQIDNCGGKRTEWLTEDKVLHREDGPAIEYQSNGSGFRIGDKFWYVNGTHTREDGPATTHANGSEFWFRDEMHHRVDGPAIVHANGSKSWHLNGRQIDAVGREGEFCAHLTMLIRCYMKEIFRLESRSNIDQLNQEYYNRISRMKRDCQDAGVFNKEQ